MRFIRIASIAILTVLATVGAAGAASRHHHHHRQGHHAHARHHHHRRADVRSPHRGLRPAHRGHGRGGVAGAASRADAVAMARRAESIDRTGLVRTAMRYLGGGNPTGIRQAWCAHFLNMVLRRSGHRAPSSGYAPAYAGYGRRSGPAVGSIAVFRGHVGIVVGRIGAELEILSGNYGHRVGIGPWPMSRAIAFRAP